MSRDCSRRAAGIPKGARGLRGGELTGAAVPGRKEGRREPWGRQEPAAPAAHWRGPASRGNG